VSRDAFEDLLNAMAGAGYVRIDEASFEKDGKTIGYRKASLTREGEEFTDRDADTVMMRELLSGVVAPAPGKARGGKRGSAARAGRAGEDEPLPAGARELEERLRAWRKAEAAKLGQPAFCVFSDRTLRALAVERPVTEDDLLGISGFGAVKAAKFGAAVCQICSVG
jgi:superfamily II DNA helicase RecQ